MTGHAENEGVEESGTTALLSEVRRQILAWETAPYDSRAEKEAAEASTRAMSELDTALCGGAELPAPWKKAAGG